MDQWARLISCRGSCPPMESVSSEQGPVCALLSWAKLCSFSLLGVSFTEADTGSLPLFQLWELQNRAPGHLSPADTKRSISLCSCSALLIPAVLWSSADTLCWPIRTPGRQQHLCKANRHGHLASGEGLGSSRALCSPVPWPVFICSV